MVIAAALFMGSVQIGKIENQTIGADFMPKIVAVLLFILSAVLFNQGRKAPAGQKKDDFVHNYKGTFLMFVLFIVYVAIFDTLGFLLSSMIYLMCALLLLSRKEEIHYIKFIAIAVIGSVVINLLFTEVFGVNLPAGILG